MNLPARLDVVLDDVGVGAMLKHLETDRRALVIDFDPRNGFPMVAMIREEWLDREDGESACEPEHYEIVKIGSDKKKEKEKGKKRKAGKQKTGCFGWRVWTEDMSKWLVLEAGHDRLLDHVEDS